MDCVPNVDILSICDICSMDFQLISKRLRWFGYVSRMQGSRLPNVMMFGQVKGFKVCGLAQKHLE